MPERVLFSIRIAPSTGSVDLELNDRISSILLQLEMLTEYSTMPETLEQIIGSNGLGPVVKINVLNLNVVMSTDYNSI